MTCNEQIINPEVKNLSKCNLKYFIKSEKVLNHLKLLWRVNF